MPTQSTRLGLDKPLGNENFTRALFNAILDEIDAIAAMDMQGTAAARPAAAAANRGLYYWATDTSELSRSTGSAWVPIPTTGLAKLAVAQTFTEDQRIEAGNQLLLGVAGSIGAAGTGGSQTHWGYNCMHDGTNWVRTIADNDANRIELTGSGEYIYYVNSDGGTTVGSTITWEERFRILKTGEVQARGNVRSTYAGGTTGTALTGDGLYYGGTDNKLGIRWTGGSPEGVVTAPVGSLFSDNSNGKLYLKVTGTGNTGWKDVSSDARIASGSYTGNNGTDRVISLPFNPHFIVVTQRAAGTAHAYYFSAINPGNGVFGAQLPGGTQFPELENDHQYRPMPTTAGFIVSGSSAATLNFNSIVYDYFAIG